MTAPISRRLLEEIIAARQGFGHRQHVELAWRCLGLCDFETAKSWMEDAIRHVAAAHGTPDLYHQTMTDSWLYLVALHRRHSAAETFDEFIEESPGLLDKHLLQRHYLPSTLSSEAARRHWVDPDREAFPPLAMT